MDVTQAPEPAARHRACAADLGVVAASVHDWDAPTPVREWTARDVVRHLVDWVPGFLAMGSPVTLTPGPSVDDDPVGALEHVTGQVQALLDDPDAASGRFETTMFEEQTLVEVIDRFWTTDLFLHRWDLARAAGIDPGLDQDVCAEMLRGMSAQEEMIRGSGQFGERQPVAEDAPADEQLMAFLGRDPDWHPA